MDIACKFILSGVLQESGHVVVLRDLFLSLSNIFTGNYADDSTPFCNGRHTSKILSYLEKSTQNLLKWFDVDWIKVMPDICHLFVNDVSRKLLGSSYKTNEAITNSKYKSLFALKIDNRIIFNEKKMSLWNKAIQKLNVLSRIAFAVTFDQIMNYEWWILFSYHFPHCPIF